jgi:3-methyladenine DNA glycosylase AlkD
MNLHILADIRHELEQQADLKTRNSSQNFFKEKVSVIGVKTFIVTGIARKYFNQLNNLDKLQIFGLCEELLKTDYIEESFIAFDWSYHLRDKYSPDDFAIFEKWIDKYINNWAKCDTLCNHTICAFIDKHPGYLRNLKKWATSENRWFRRAAAVTLIIPAKQGKFLVDILEIADILLLDNDDLVQKGYGWMLKESSRMHQNEVFEYILRNKKVMPRTALRYAIEKMPQDLKHLAMDKN